MPDLEVTASATTTPRLVDRPPQQQRRSIQRGGALAELIPARQEVAQLRQEAAFNRQPTSNTIPKMIRFVLERDAGDNLLTRRPNQFDNPLDRRCCYCTIM